MKAAGKDITSVGGCRKRPGIGIFKYMADLGQVIKGWGLNRGPAVDCQIIPPERIGADYNDVMFHFS